MRNAIGGTWLFGLVATFIVLMSGFLAISINYHKAYLVRSDLIDMIEQREHYDAEIVDNYFNQAGNFATGRCPDLEEYGKSLSSKNANGKSRYCVYYRNADDDTNIPKAYYKVNVFFKIDLPVIRSIFTMRVPGTTKIVWDFATRR